MSASRFGMFRARRQRRRPGLSPHGTFVCLLGPVGLRQDHAAADDRRAGGADRGPDPARRPGHHDAADAPARLRHGVPVAGPVPASDGRREHRLSRCASAACRQGDQASARRGTAGAGAPAAASPTGRCRKLSGGQRQRVAIARALALSPKLFLLDEPLSALDAKLREAMQVELRQLQQRLGITTIVVTHDQREAMTMADIVVVMGDGRDPAGGARRSRSTASRPTPSSPTSSAPPTCCRCGAGRRAGRARRSARAIPGLALAGRTRQATLSVRPEDVHLARRPSRRR